MELYEVIFKRDNKLLRYLVASHSGEVKRRVYNIDGAMSLDSAVAVKKLSSFSAHVFEPSNHVTLDNREEHQAIADKIVRIQEILQSLANDKDDKEAAHAKADTMMCEALELLGHADLVQAYLAVPKWYS